MNIYKNQWALIVLPRIGIPRVVACSRVVGIEAENLDCDPVDMGINPGAPAWLALSQVGANFAIWEGSIAYPSDDNGPEFTGSLRAVGSAEANMRFGMHQCPPDELPEEQVSPDGLG